MIAKEAVDREAVDGVDKIVADKIVADKMDKKEAQTDKRNSQDRT